MTSSSKTRCIGILTAGGDCPGLNAAIRALVKAAIIEYNMEVIGIYDGFRGLVENRTVHLDMKMASGILTHGGTILGTSRDKPHKMPMGNKVIDMTQVATDNVQKLHIDCLVCLGGGGTQKNALRLHNECGMNVVTLPKTIDNDVWGTEVTFGYHTAMQIATEAIDRLHTTATSHHRIIVCEIMGHNSGWLTLGAGIAGGADVILIPELPYDLNIIADYLLERRRAGKRFSIIAVAEGARSINDLKLGEMIEDEDEEEKAETKEIRKAKKNKKVEEADELAADNDSEDANLVIKQVRGEERAFHLVQEPMASRVARQLQEMTGTEARVTSLGHVLRGGVPSAFDRMLCTRLGAKAVQLMAEGVYNVMVGYNGGVCVPVDLEEVADRRKTVPRDHPMVNSARLVGTCFGDK